MSTRYDVDYEDALRGDAGEIAADRKPIIHRGATAAALAAAVVITLLIGILAVSLAVLVLRERVALPSAFAPRPDAPPRQRPADPLVDFNGNAVQLRGRVE